MKIGSKLLVTVLVLGLAAPVAAMPPPTTGVVDEATDLVAKDRRQQQVTEATYLLQEKIRLEKRLAEITARLIALDNDADPKSEGIVWSSNGVVTIRR